MKKYRIAYAVRSDLIYIKMKLFSRDFSTLKGKNILNLIY